MGFRKAVFAKSQNLLIDAFCKVLSVTPFTHALYQSFLIMTESAVTLPGCHVPPQAVGLAGRESRCHHGELDDLLLKDRDAQGSFQHFPDRLTGVGHRLFAVTSPEIRMHHIALDRPRADNSHLNDQVIKAARPQAGQHGHLRTGFDLKDTYRIGIADHPVNLRVFCRHGRHGHRNAPMLLQEIKRAVNRTQHTQRKTIDFKQPKDVDIGFIPLNNGALRHGSVLDRHQVAQRLFRNHKSSGML